jgi:hypothetical protein
MQIKPLNYIETKNKVTLTKRNQIHNSITYNNKYNNNIKIIKSLQTIFILFFLTIPISTTNLKSKFTQDFFEQKKIEIQNLLEKKTQTQNNQKSGSSSATSLSLSANELSEAKLLFGSLNNFFSFSLRGKYHDFVLFSNSKPLLIASPAKNDIMIFSKHLKPENGIEFSGSFKIRGISQWKLVFEEDLKKQPNGWSKNTVTECGGIRMLGGYCQFSSGEVLKTIENLPVHAQLRVEATFHFIDAWHGEAGFLRIDNGKDNEMQYAWVENYSAFEGAHGINVCGGKWPEGKFSVPINVAIPHKAASVKIGFGSTTEQDACDQSFGVSGIRIYIR